MSRCIILVFILSACAPSPKYLSEADRGSLGHVGVVSAQFQPDINLTLPAKGAGSGAWRGAKEGAKDVIIGSAITPLPGAIILGILLSPVVAAGGAIYGAIAAPPAEAVSRHEKVLASISQRLEINRNIRKSIVRYANEKASYPLTDLGEIGPAKPDENANYLRLALNGTDTVLEVSASDLSTEGAAINSPFKITINADMRLIRAADGVVSASYHPRYASHSRTLQAWAANDGALFQKALQKGVAQISRETVYKLLLVYHADSSEAKRNRNSSVKTVIHPPEVVLSRLGKLESPLFSSDIVIANTLKPEFCWKPFPAEQGSSDNETNRLFISQISYQLEVKQDDETVYEVNHLTGPCHRLKQALKWDNEYNGFVKMWFNYHGHMRATQPGKVLFKTPSMPVSQ